MNLNIFNESNGVFAGVNTPQFSQLEYLIATANTTKCQIPSLGLFGEASTGKTSSAKIIASAAKYEYLYFNASYLTVSNLNKVISKSAVTLMDSLQATDRYPLPCVSSTRFKYVFTKPLLILIDEAHELSKDIQTHFLTVLEEKGMLNDDGESSSIDTKNITFVFATTDSSKLLYPLTTRLFNIIFEQYSKEDIMNIIKLKYKNISNGGLEILAQCSKFVPRIALRFSEQLNNMASNSIISDLQTEQFVKTFLNMEPNGIDPIDKRILLYLANNKKQIAPIDTISLQAYKETITRLEKKSILSSSEHAMYNKAKFNISVLENKINTASFAFKSRQDISLACRILDLTDLETRLSYLEKLNFVVKSSKGICLSDEYL